MKKTVTVFTALLLVLVLGTTAFAASGTWKKSSGKWWYQYEDGSYPSSSWAKIGGKWYHFDSKGYMQTGWQKISGKWYYLGTNGAMVTGWQKINNKWYYLGSNGVMATGWQKISNKWYYLDTGGVMVTGWQKISRKWYYFNSSGIMQTGWLKLNGKWYYLNSSGAMVTGTVTIGGKQYTFDSNGVWQSTDTAGWKAAYAQIVKNYESEYGNANFLTMEDFSRYSSISGYPRAGGVFYLELLDMDLNGSYELLIGYAPGEYVFSLDIYEYKNGKASCCLSLEEGVFGIGVDIRNYCLHYYSGKAYICTGSSFMKMNAKLYGYQGGTFQLLKTYAPETARDGDYSGNIDFGYGLPDRIVNYTVYGISDSDKNVLINKVKETKSTLGIN